MTNFTEETINPEVTIGKSITYTVMIVTVIYTLIGFASLFVINSGDLAKTATPLATITGKMFGSYGYFLFILLAILSLFDTLLVTSVSESRYMHSFFSHMVPSFKNHDMDKTHKTPYISIILLVLLSAVVIYIFKNIGTTAICGDLLILSIFIIVNVIVIVLRYKRPDEPRKYRVPFNIGKVPIPSVLAIIMGIYVMYQHVSTCS
jgi:APA family basic amino acid/polyamine antiporter